MQLPLKFAIILLSFKLITRRLMLLSHEVRAGLNEAVLALEGEWQNSGGNFDMQGANLYRRVPIYVNLASHPSPLTCLMLSCN